VKSASSTAEKIALFRSLLRQWWRRCAYWQPVSCRESNGLALKKGFGLIEVSDSFRDGSRHGSLVLGLKARGLHGVEFVVADDHAGLRAALRARGVPSAWKAAQSLALAG